MYRGMPPRKIRTANSCLAIGRNPLPQWILADAFP